MRKRFAALLVALALLPIPALGAEEVGFSDVPADSWYAQGIETCVEAGIMVGTGEGVFSPEKVLTEEECLTLALRLYDRQRGGTGELEQAPEDWGTMTLTLADGTQFVRSGEWSKPFGWWSWKNGLDELTVSLPGETIEERRVWGDAHAGPATLTVEGVECAGSVRCWLPVGDYILAFTPDRTAPEEVNERARAIVYGGYPTADKWYQDAYYTAYAWGMDDEETHPAFAQMLTPLGAGRSAHRDDFARLLSETAGELPKTLEVPELPDLERDGDSEGVFALYEAGILTGTDQYGGYSADAQLTRAQAAVMIARLVDESQRVTQAPQPLPTEGYTLTPLVTGEWTVRNSLTSQNGLETYPLLGLEDGRTWTTAGERLDPLPETSFYRQREGFCLLYHYLPSGNEDGGMEEDYEYALMDRNGEIVAPFGLYTAAGNSLVDWEDTFTPTADGHIVAMKGEEWFLLAGDGTVERSLPDPETLPRQTAEFPYDGGCNTWTRFNEGLAPMMDESGKWGYVDADGAWVIEPQFSMAEPFLDGCAIVDRKDDASSYAPADQTSDRVNWYQGVIDREGNMVLDFQYRYLRNCGGEVVTGTYCGGEQETIGAWVNGAKIDSAYTPLDLRVRNGYGVYENYTEAGQFYLDSQLRPVSQKFDWCGEIGPDGRGFAALGDTIYIIQFAKSEL